MDKIFTPANWIILAAVMVIIEIITLGLSSIWFAVGAIGSAITAALDGPEWLQVVVFMVVSTVFLLVLKPLAKKKLNVKVVPTNAQSLIGTKVKVLKLTDKPGIAITRINDVEWRISYDGEMQVGDDLTIADISGTKLICKKEYEPLPMDGTDGQIDHWMVK